MGTYHVTPSLMVGEMPDLDRATRVNNIRDAIAAIQYGSVAVLPLNGWSLVPQILRALGLQDSEVAERISMARIGES